MHRPTLSRTQRRARTRRASTTWTRTLKNWLTGYRASRNWPRGSRLRGWGRCSRRRLVHRARPGVRHDHPRGRCLWTRRRNGCRWFRCHWSAWLWRSTGRRSRRNWGPALYGGRRHYWRRNRSRRSRSRWGPDRRRRRLRGRRCRNRECRSRGMGGNDDPRCGCRGGRWWRSRSLNSRSRRDYG